MEPQLDPLRQLMIPFGSDRFVAYHTHCVCVEHLQSQQVATCSIMPLLGPSANHGLLLLKQPKCPIICQQVINAQAIRKFAVHSSLAIECHV